MKITWVTLESKRGVRRVRTAAGARAYGVPIGSPIIAHPRKPAGRAYGDDAPWTANQRKPSVNPLGRVAPEHHRDLDPIIAPKRTSKPGQDAFDADLAKINAYLEANDAVRTESDGFQWIDTSQVDPETVRTYNRLLQHGYANGLLGDDDAAPDPPDAPKVDPLTDAEFAAHVKQVEAKTKAAKDAGLETHKTHTVKKGDAVGYTPERQRLHAEIVDEIWAGQNGDAVPTEGKGLFTGGLGGAGKGTVLKSKTAGIDKTKYITVNPDDIKEILAKRGEVPVLEGVSPMEASTLIHEESSDVAALLAARAVAEKKNIIYDITMASESSVSKRITGLEAAGYTQIDVIFVDIPPEKSVERAMGRYRAGMERHRNGEGAGGRYVPPSYIMGAKGDGAWSSTNRGVFEAMKTRYDNWSVYDTSADAPPGGKPPDPVLVSDSSAPGSPKRDRTAIPA